jgi:FkbM family methyltransferase
MSLYTESLNFKNGIYVELGANDGTFQSNTKWLEDDLNWTGILIEPSLVGYDSCLRTRPNNKIYNCACVSFHYSNETVCGDFNGHAMSSINGDRLNNGNLIEVKAKTLQSIIDDSGYFDIDFLSLDVEGYEFEVLNGIDFNKTKIKYMLIEIYNKDKEDIFSFLEQNNYEFLENVTDFNMHNNPRWDGTHNDYFFKLKT